MFRSPQKLRSGTKGAPVPLSKPADKPADKKLQRSQSVPSASPPKTTIMPASDKVLDPAAVEHCVNTYLTSSDVVSQLVTRLSQEMKGIVEAAVQSGLAAVNKEILKLRDEVSSLTDKLRELEGRMEVRMDDLEQYYRRNNLRVFGVKETAGEDTDGIILKLCRERLGVELSANAISRSHRVGKSVPDVDGRKRHRAIIVRFVSYRDRHTVYAAKKKLKSTGVSIREDLTARRMNVYRKAVERHGPRNIWTQDGRVLWLDKDGKKGMATHLADIRNN